MSLRANLAPSHSSPIRWGKQKAAWLFSLLWILGSISWIEPFASIDRKSRIEILEILKELALDGKTVILCDHDLSDYEAYIDHMVELRDGQLREVFQIPTSEMTQVSSKNVASSPELFHMDRTTCELDKRPPLFNCGFYILPRNFLYLGWQWCREINPLSLYSSISKV